MTKGQQKETDKRQKDLVINPGSERNLISICLKNSEKLIDVEAEDIYGEHFSVLGHKYIFIAMMYLYSKKIKPTPLSIMEVLNSESAKEAVEELGGLEYLIILEESNIPVDNLQIFIEKIKQSFARRMMIMIADEVREFALSEVTEVLNPSEIVSFALNKIDDLQVKTSSSEQVYKMGKNTEEVLNKRAETPMQVPGLEVGWTEFDRLTNGASEGELIIVVAPSKVGKSVTLTNWATKFGIQDRFPILYFDTEMSERQQEDRILANLTGIPHSEIVSGMYVMDTANGRAEDKVKRLKEAREKLNLGEYYHIYMPHFNIEKVSALAKKFVTQLGVKAIFFDYIKIPSSEADFRSMQEYQALGFFTSGLKDLGGILKVPVFTACQTNRNDLKTSDPDASNIGGSYRILQLADKLMFLINKSDEAIARDGIQNGNQQLFIKYQRNGASDCDPINIMFHRHILRQEEV